MKTVSMVACVSCAIAAFGVALFMYMDVSMYGFPDGYVTDYQKAAETPLTILTWAEAGFGLLFLALAFSPIGTRLRTILWLAALVAFVLVATAAQLGVPWYFQVHLGLDNGVGG